MTLTKEQIKALLDQCTDTREPVELRRNAKTLATDLLEALERWDSIAQVVRDWKDGEVSQMGALMFIEEIYDAALLTQEPKT